VKREQPIRVHGPLVTLRWKGYPPSLTREPDYYRAEWYGSLAMGTTREDAEAKMRESILSSMLSAYAYVSELELTRVTRDVDRIGVLHFPLGAQP
jgi:hypothetical protein